MQQKQARKQGADGALDSQIDRLLDRWVLSLEQAPPRPIPGRLRAPRRTSRSEQEPAPLTGEAEQRSEEEVEPLRSETPNVESAERTREPELAASAAAVTPAATAWMPEALGNLQVTPAGPQLVLVRVPRLDDGAEEPEGILLHRHGDLYLHRGTRLTRGPQPGLLPLAKELGAGNDVAHALDFLAAWFGAAFDALQPSKEGLRWGAFRLPIDALSHTLADLQERDADRYERLLGCFGLRIVLGAADEPPSLALPGAPASRLPAKDSGPLASLRLLENPGLAAVLARALGHEPLLRAQIGTVISQVCQPALAAVVPDGSEAIDERLQDGGARRLVTGIILARWRLGTAADELLMGLLPKPTKRVGNDATAANEEALLSALEARLRSAGHHALADSIVFIRLSKELAVPAATASSAGPRSTSRKTRT